MDSFICTTAVVFLVAIYVGFSYANGPGAGHCTRDRDGSTTEKIGYGYLGSSCSPSPSKCWREVPGSPWVEDYEDPDACDDGVSCELNADCDSGFSCPSPITPPLYGDCSEYSVKCVDGVWQDDDGDWWNETSWGSIVCTADKLLLEKPGFSDENEGHIDLLTGISQCFGANQYVDILRNGSVHQMFIQDLKVGEKVRTVDSAGKLHFQDTVYLRHHIQPEYGVLVELHTKTLVQMTAEHLIYLGRESEDYCITVNDEQGCVFPAKDARVGDVVFVAHGEELIAEEIMAVTQSIGQIFSPFTLGGNIVVNGVAASCHRLHHTFGQSAIQPIKMVYYLWPGGTNNEYLESLWFTLDILRRPLRDLTINHDFTNANGDILVLGIYAFLALILTVFAKNIW